MSNIICEDLPKTSTEKSETGHYHSFVHATKNPNYLPEIGIKSHWQLKPIFLPDKYKNIAEDFANFEVRNDDVWIITFPKSGTTWTQEMVWMISNNLDFEGGKKALANERFTFIDYDFLRSFNKEIPLNSRYAISSLAKAKRMKSPRFIKTHLPAELLPKQIWTVRPKIIYTARNPKDAAISYFHHYRNLELYNGSFTDFMEIFLNDQVVSSPIHNHILNFWRMRNEENILFLTYERMKRDLPSVMHEVARFFGKSYTTEQYNNLEKHLHVDSMRSNEATNCMEHIGYFLNFIGEKKQDDDFTFIRKGIAGGFITDMSPEFIKRFDNWSAQELAGTGFQFEL